MNLKNKEIAAYRAILQLKRATIVDIARKADLKRTTIYNFIDKLILNKLIKKILINGRAYYAPIRDLNSLITKDKINLGETGKIVIGKILLKSEIQKTLKERQIDFIADSQTTTELLGNHFFEKYIEQAKNKGIVVRVLRSSVSKARHKYHSPKAIEEMGRLVRQSQSTIPYHGTIIIFGHQMILLSSANGGTGYVIKDEIITQTFKNLFNGLWKYSKIVG